ncbi:MAG: cellulase family glycosylhydrolase [Planctomycetota bacterium]
MFQSLHRTLIAVHLVFLLGIAAFAGERWPEKQAAEWYSAQPWMVGCNYTPRTAINQLEFWQADTFDPKTIDQELTWAQGVGFNVLRVYLHDILYQQDADGFFKRMDEFLSICEKHGIRVMFVLLDDCWDPNPKPGKQREPRPHVHNSGWLQCPGTAILSKPERHDELKPYVQGVIRRFKDDKRVLCWDLYNEPGNDQNSKYPGQDPSSKGKLSARLLEKAFDWARQVNPTQPLTAGLWEGDWADPNKMSPINKLCVERSDIMTFHCYNGGDVFKARAEIVLRRDRPAICTEYLNRNTGCTFQSVLPYMKEKRIGAINWGLVTGKIQTQYPWSSWNRSFNAEPATWFHDILRPDGKPFNQTEIDLIRQLTCRGGVSANQ